MTTIQQIQTLLGVLADNKWGPKTQAALDALIKPSGWKNVMASTFADPADVAAFRRCKAKGNSDMTCFAVGDNGVGAWGDNTADGPPMCALPPEDLVEKWGSVIGGKHRDVVVLHDGKEYRCIVGDLMPHRRNIKNGCGLDMNPSLCKLIGHTPPATVPIAWKWA